MCSGREEISDLLFRYAELVDAGHFAGVADLLAGATLTFEGSSVHHAGRAAILRFFEATTRRYEDGTPRTKHVTTNVVIEVDEAGATAQARSYFTVLQATPEHALAPVVSGRYRDRFARHEGAWRFTARHMIPDLIGDVTRHLLVPVDPLGDEDGRRGDVG